jgi:hypothetical protein
VRAQYAAGKIDDLPVPGYHQEKGVARDSRTETYAALELSIDNWRWAGVPFYMRTGKCLARQVTEITVHFRQAPVSLFPNTNTLESNSITLRIQPDEGISLVFGAKQPRVGKQATAVSMDFCYRSAFAGQPPSAYAVLLLDAMRGDPTQFTPSRRRRGAMAADHSDRRGLGRATGRTPALLCRRQRWPGRSRSPLEPQRPSLAFDRRQRRHVSHLRAERLEGAEREPTRRRDGAIDEHSRSHGYWSAQRNKALKVNSSYTPAHAAHATR